MVKTFIEEFREDFVNKKSVIEIVMFLDSLNDKDRDFILRFMISDYYKLNIYNNIYNNTEYFSFDELIDSFLDNAEILKEIIISTKYYSSLDFISKSIIIEEIEKYGKNEFIESISTTYKIEQSVYKFNYDIESFKEYYIDYLNKNEKELEKRSTASTFITQKILELKNIDKNKYINYMLEMLAVYYKWKLFIKDHDGTKLLFSNDLKYIEDIKNKSIDEIFIDLNSNYDFLHTIVGEYLHYATQNTKLDEVIVDKYLKCNSSESFQKKLKID